MPFILPDPSRHEKKCVVSGISGLTRFYNLLDKFLFCIQNFHVHKHYASDGKITIELTPLRMNKGWLHAERRSYATG